MLEGKISLAAVEIPREGCCAQTGIARNRAYVEFECKDATKVWEYSPLQCRRFSFTCNPVRCTCTGAPCATQVMKRIYYDGKSADLWGCGVVLFTMLAGVSPYDKEHDMVRAEGGGEVKHRLPDE